MNIIVAKRLSLILSLFSVFLSCESGEDDYKDINYGMLGYVISDNPNLSSFYDATTRSGIWKTLSEDGNYTVFAPSDDAFNRVSAYFPDALTGQIELVSNMTRYHVLQGTIDFNEGALGIYKEVQTMSGHNMYYTRWYDKYKKDTIMMVNGCIVNKRYASAYNGYLYVLDRVLSLPTHQSLLDMINERDDLTLFAQAIVRADMKHYFDGNETYSVFVPNNNAMYNYGYTSLASIRSEDPTALKQIILRHMLPGRSFIKDFYVNSSISYQSNIEVDTWTGLGAASRVGQDGLRGSVKRQMLDGKQLDFIYSYSELLEYGFLDGERLELVNENQQKTKVHLVYRDYAAFNGVLHVVESVLPGI